MKLKPLLSTVALAAAALVAAPVSAAPNTLTYQDVTFEMSVVDSDTFNLTILNADAASGDWAGISFISAFQVKGIGDFASASVVSGPGSWTRSTNELNANGCTGGGGLQTMCFTSSPVALVSSMSWNIDFSGALPDFATTPPHLKVNFMASATQSGATGSLLSQDIPAVPEPETYALMLAGLAAVGFVARRRKMA